MKTNEHLEDAVFPQTLTDAVSKLKKRLQRDYERAYPGLGDIIRIVLDEEEAKAWDLSFPHLFLPDLVEAHVEQLGLQPGYATYGNRLAPADFAKIEHLQPVPALCG